MEGQSDLQQGVYGGGQCTSNGNWGQQQSAQQGFGGQSHQGMGQQGQFPNIGTGTNPRMGGQMPNMQPMGPDPAFGQPSMGMGPVQGSSVDANYIRNLVPHLAHMSDEWFLAQPIDTIQRLLREEKQAEGARSAKGLEARLHSNFNKASQNPIFLSGYDNRVTSLHPARFLPGAGVPVQNFWLEARRLWGQEGVDGIQNYDLEALGCSGCVSARGWELLHKPGSPEMSLKMFTITNIGNMASSSTTISLVGEDGITIQENLREFSDLQEFKQAMYNLRTAAQLATPWNLSYAVIDGFLRSNNYMDSQLEGVKKAVVLTGFVDHVLKVNASMWVREAAFLDSAKLMAVWNAWWGSRRSKVVQDGDGAGAKGQGGGSEEQAEGPKGERGLEWAGTGGLGRPGPGRVGRTEPGRMGRPEQERRRWPESPVHRAAGGEDHLQEVQ